MKNTVFYGPHSQGWPNRCDTFNQKGDWAVLKEAMFYKKMEDGEVSCFLCSHHCLISDGTFGICSVRENRKGLLSTHAYGKLIARNIDPIEKKPLYHFLPGSRSFSIAAIGCNFQCGFCQNWQISQVEEAKTLASLPKKWHRKRWSSSKRIGNGKHLLHLRRAHYFFRVCLWNKSVGKKNGLSNVVFVTDWLITLVFKRDTSKLM